MENSDKQSAQPFGGKAATQEFLKLMKASFDATFDNAVKLQSMNETMLKTMIERGKELQADGLKVVEEAIANANKGRDEYRKAMEEGFKKMEDLMKTG